MATERSVVQVARVLVFTCLAAIASALLAASPIGLALERDAGLPLLLWLRGPIPPPPQVVVIAQDYASAEALGLPPKLGGWPRHHMARVIKQAHVAGARAVAIDLTLETARDAIEDAALEDAIAAHGSIVIVESMGKSQRSGPTEGLVLVEERAQPPLPRFAAAAEATAPFPLPDEGLRVGAFWAFKTGAEGRPTLPAATLLTAALSDADTRRALLAAARAQSMPIVAGLIARPDLSFKAQVDGLRQALRRNHAVPRLIASVRATTSAVLPRQLAIAALALLAGPDTYLLVPYGPAGHVPRVSYHRVVAGDADALALLKDKIVFIGSSDLSNQVERDTYATAFGRPDGIRMAGVEVAATACLNLLRREAAQPALVATAMTLAGTSAALAALAGMLLPTILGLAAALAIAAALAEASPHLLATQQVALPLGSILLASLPLGLLTGRLCCHGAVRRQLDRAIDFLTRGRVKAADPLHGIEHAGRLQERWAVCLATDIADYVQLTESMLEHKPMLADLMVDYHELVQTVVERHGGSVLDFSGDASMCLWEADAPERAVRARAVRAALELVERLERAAMPELAAHRTRVGLAEGTIVVGNLAGDRHFVFGGVGEPLNIAARLEQLNKQLGTQILATAAVVDGLEGVPMRPVGPVWLKGKRDPEQVVALGSVTA